MIIYLYILCIFFKYTGRTAPKKRQKLWRQHKVYFVSPQTLSSDLNRSTVPVNRITLLVLDEAHKGTGEHSYHVIVRDVYENNPQIRILALTATPGQNTEKIQILINNLNISLMDIRYEDDKDIVKYRHETIEEKYDCKLSSDLNTIRHKIVLLIQKEMNLLFINKAITGYQPDGIVPYNVQVEMKRLRERRDLDEGTKWNVFSSMHMLRKLALLRIKLEHYSLGVMIDTLERLFEENSGIGGFGNGVKGPNKPKAKGGSGLHTMRRLKADRNFQDLTTLAYDTMKRQGEIHPKMKRLVEILTIHFQNVYKQGLIKNNSRVMVFTSLRQSVHDIVEYIKKHSEKVTLRIKNGNCENNNNNNGNGNGNVNNSMLLYDCDNDDSNGERVTQMKLLKPFAFVGQNSNGKNIGLTQKEQLRVIADFKRGIYNILVTLFCRSCFF